MSKINRREFLAGTSLTAAGIVLGNSIGSCNEEAKSVISSYDVMKEILKFRKIDAHAHPPDNIVDQIEIADRLGITKLQISEPSVNPKATPDEIRKNNDTVIAAVKKYPDRYIGFFTLNPAYPKESMEELKRCVDLGFTGYKGYTQVKVNDPLYYPVIEKLIELKMIVFMHTFTQLGMAGYRMKYNIGTGENTTLPEDIVDAAKRYPEATFHFAHIGGGGDWEYQCKTLAECPNIYVDTGGSNNEENIIDFAIRHLGEDRIFFGCDGSFHHGVGRVMASDTTDEQKRKIFFDNYSNVLKRGGRNVA